MGQNFVQFLILALAVGAPVLSWLAGKIKEAHELKRLRDTARKNYEEQLRTGRAPAQPPAATTEQAKPARTAADLQALAERRQQQLRELRERQIGQAPATAPSAPRAPSTQPVQRPTRAPGVRRPMPGGKPGGTSPVRPVAVRSPKQVRESARDPARSDAPARRDAQAPTPPGVQAVRPALVQAMVQQHVAAAEPAKGGPPVPMGMRSIAPTRQELRRAIVLSELLNRPVSLRDEP